MYSQLYTMGIIHFLYRGYEGAGKIRERGEKEKRGGLGRGENYWKGGEIRKILRAQIARPSEKGEETRGVWSR